MNSSHSTQALKIGGALLAALFITPYHSYAADLPDKQPRWEAGIGVGALTLADYPGADQQRGYLLPLPYFVYRGDNIKADRNGVRGRIFDSEAVDVELSMSASAPVRSDKNQARDGMPGLDPTVEIGPQLRWHLSPDQAADYQLDLRVPLRFVYAFNHDGVRSVGSVLSPALNLDVKHFLAKDWTLGVNVGPSFASRSYNAYYYDVAPAYARGNRPAYEAKSGYSGMQFTSALSRRSGQYWIGGFLRLNELGGAVFRDSPLVKQRYAFSAGIGFAYIFAKSAELVDARHEP